MKRGAGQANYEEHPKGSGRYRVRARKDGKLTTIASGLSKGDAKSVADAYANLRHASVLREGITLAQFGEGFLDRRELQGVRAIRTDRSIWKKHIAGAPIGALPVATLERRDVVEWRDELRGKHRSRLKRLNLLRVALADAVDRGVLQQNPARDVKIHRSGAARSTDDLEGILSPAEQQKLIEAVTPRFRPLVVFALVSGLRQAEQWWLDWESVLTDRVVVRRSTGGLPPKSGKPREVFLLGPALAALASTRRRSEFVFCGTRGARRQEGKAPSQWASWVTKAGITRRVRWHDLRHTCATSLLAGWWGRKWSLDEVCRMLGHSSITVTERYARKLAETQQLAVAATPMADFVVREVPSVFPASPKKLAKTSEPIVGLEPTTCALRKGIDPDTDRDVRSAGVPTLGTEHNAQLWALALAAERVLAPVATGTIPGTIKRRKRGRHAG